MLCNQLQGRTCGLGYAPVFFRGKRRRFFPAKPWEEQRTVASWRFCPCHTLSVFICGILRLFERDIEVKGGCFSRVTVTRILIFLLGGITPGRRWLATMVINHVLAGMIFQVGDPKTNLESLGSGHPTRVRQLG